MSEPHEPGLTIRMIRNYKPEGDIPNVTLLDQALRLALSDDRDIPIADKLSDAIKFLVHRRG